MGDAFREFTEACSTPSDINEHVAHLAELTGRCRHVTEMGVRHGVSTRGILWGRPAVYRGYDVTPPPELLAELAAELGVDYHHYRKDVLKIKIKPTDLLFIDTRHTYRQLRRELARHGWAVRRFIVLHDTAAYATHDEGDPASTDGPRGIQAAVDAWLDQHPEWEVLSEDKTNNGLTVLWKPHARHSVLSHHL